MTKEELVKNVTHDAVALSENLPRWADTIAVRYDNKDGITIGDELDYSISNTDRDDERDFPGYDPDAEKMGGVSAYLVANALDDEDDIGYLQISDFLHGKKEAAWDHCSLIIGRRTDDFCEDVGEVVLAAAEVVKVYW